MPIATDTPRRIVVKAPAMGAPRQTRRDAWKPRPCVQRYRAWRDLVRLQARNVPPPEKVARVLVTAYYALPPSWSKRKRTTALMDFKRTKPDGDNILKGVLDALWPQDAALGDLAVCRRWGLYDETHIEIWVTHA